MSDPAALLSSLMGGQQQSAPPPLMGSTLPLRASPTDELDPRELIKLLLSLLQGGMGGMQPPMDQGMSPMMDPSTMGAPMDPSMGMGGPPMDPMMGGMLGPQGY